ncbi:protein Aster-B-like [Aricia agestis]|uniref:protein Aster-B-like n=1 Tax=Aricia agestis TaxID=91739 RepID=UPI001C20A3F1|nr:protein Aster-B-like [Aricia agestis]
MTTSEVESRNISLSMRKSVENLVISSQDAIGQSISQAITFSGVITQPNQTQETRNVSRSPSPSLRNSDSPLDAIDSDRKSETSLQVPAGISLGVDASSLLNLAAKDKIPSDKRSVDGTGRAKKKSWYNSLYPTYKSKCDDFRRLFKDLPDDERLIVDYSCALQRDILAHGRLYASQTHLCFYASIFGWETSLTLRWKDVTAITKEKTALVIPNAILVCTETEKHFLTSFSGRDKAYLMLFRVWQNALMDQPVGSHEIWQWVHTCYGSELGFDSDEDPHDADDVLPLPDAIEELESSMEASGGGEERTTRSSSRGRDSTPPILTNGGGDAGLGGDEEGAEAGDTLPTDMSDTSESEPDKHHEGGSEKCTSPHEGRLVLQQQFPYNIDHLFTMIFTNSKFNLELLAARGTTDYVQAPWQPQNGLKCRQVSYTLGLTSGPIGPKEVHVTETQVMNKCSKAGSLYSIDATSENAGIPYADHFDVRVHYCLARVTEHATRLTLYMRVHYKKTMWPMIKAFLEKNATSGIEEFARLLETRLHAAARPHAAPPARARRRRRDASPLACAPGVSVSAAPAAAGGGAGRGLLLALLLLLLLNAALYWRLYRADRTPLQLDDLYSRVSTLHTGGGGGGGDMWGEGGARRQHEQLQAWRDALQATVKHLLQTEQALSKLLDTMKPIEKTEPDPGKTEL